MRAGLRESDCSTVYDPQQKPMQTMENGAATCRGVNRQGAYRHFQKLPNLPGCQPLDTLEGEGLHKQKYRPRCVLPLAFLIKDRALFFLGKELPRCFCFLGSRSRLLYSIRCCSADFESRLCRSDRSRRQSRLKAPYELIFHCSRLLRFAL